jgi:hypothetical protein
MQPDTRNDKYYVLVISDYQQASFRDVDGDPGRYKLGMRSNFLNWTASINVTGKAFFFLLPKRIFTILKGCLIN